MDKDQSSASQRLDARIAALLDGGADGATLVDRLMAMPPPDEEAGEARSEWDRAVARQFERQLVRMMRSTLGEEPGRRRA